MTAALYSLICLIWGSTWVAIKVGLIGVPPFLGAGLRFLLATLLVGLVLIVRRRRFQLTRVHYFQPLGLRVNRAGNVGLGSGAGSGSPAATLISCSRSFSFGRPAS